MIWEGRRRILPIFMALLMVFAMAPLSIGGAQKVYADDDIWYASDLQEGEDFIVDSSGTLLLDADKNIKTLIFNSQTLTIKDDGNNHTLTVDNIYSTATDSNLTLESGNVKVVDSTFTPAYCAFIGGDLNIKGGELDITYAQTGDTNVYGLNNYRGTVNVSDGRLNVEVQSENGNAYGIITDNFVVSHGEVNVETKAGGHSYGIQAGDVDVSGGKIDFYAEATEYDKTAVGMHTNGSAGTWSFKDGEVTTTGIAVSNGYGFGIDLWDGTDTDKAEIIGGKVTAIGNCDGIRVTSKTLHIGGTADVTAKSDVEDGSGSGIDSDTDLTIDGEAFVKLSSKDFGGIEANDSLTIGGTARVNADAAINGLFVRDDLTIKDEAAVNTKGAEGNGIQVMDSMTVEGLPSIWAEGRDSSGEGGAAVYAAGGISLGKYVRITTPADGTLNPEGTVITESDQMTYAKLAIIEPIPVYKVNVVCWDRTKGQKITEGASIVWNGQNTGKSELEELAAEGERYDLDLVSDSKYTYKGWALSSPEASIISGSAADSRLSRTMGTSEVWLYAIFESPKTEITALSFTTNALPKPGSAVTDVEVTADNEGIIFPSTGGQTGKAFWYTDETCSTAYTGTFAEGDTVYLRFLFHVKNSHKFADGIASNIKVDGASPQIISISGISGYAALKYTVGEPIPVLPEVTLTDEAFVYNGKVQLPGLAVKVRGADLDPSQYEITYSSGCKNVGKYAVTVTITGEFTGTNTLYFQIDPKGTKLSKLYRYKKALKVKWKKQSSKMSKSRITGYEIMLATDSGFTENVKTVTVKGYKKTSKKVKSLKAKTKYYVQVRTYKTVSGTKYYSPWSESKSATTK